MDYDLLHIQGKPYVLVPLHDFRELTTQNKAENDNALPDNILDALAARQDHPVKIKKYSIFGVNGNFPGGFA